MESLAGLDSSQLQGPSGLFFGTLSRTVISPIKQLMGRPAVKGVASSTISPRSLLHSMVKAVQFMKNVVALEFEWRDLPLTSQSRLFLNIIGTNFSTSLHKLVLRARISSFAEFLAISDFDNVDEVDFHFDYVAHGNQDPLDTALDDEGKGLVEVIAPFINRHARNLRSLVISSSSRVDLSPFFQRLGPLPNLNHLGLHVSFDLAHLSDPHSLVESFFHSRTSLRQVDFTPNPPQDHAATQPHAGWTDVQRLLRVRTECLHDLVSVELPYTTPEQTFPILACSVSTLRHLKLTGNFLDSSEIERVLRLFADYPFQLRHLRIGAKILDVPLLALLAKRLPALRSLDVIYQATNAYHSPDVERVSCPFQRFDHFKIKSAVPAFEGWPLEELSFYSNRYAAPVPVIDPYRRGRLYTMTGNIMTTLNIQFGLAFVEEIPSLCRIGGYAISQPLHPPCRCFPNRFERVKAMKCLH